MNNIPSFLNTPEKWLKCVKETKTKERYEDVMHTLLSDDSLKSRDILQIMKLLESDIVKYHQKDEFHSVLDVAEQIISYMISYE